MSQWEQLPLVRVYEQERDMNEVCSPNPERSGFPALMSKCHKCNRFYRMRTFLI